MSFPAATFSRPAFRHGLRQLLGGMLLALAVACLSSQAAGGKPAAGRAAAHPAVTSTAYNIPWAPRKREFRGAWIATVHNLDWPSKPDLPAWQQKAEFTALLDRLVAAHFNAVVVQVRPAGDALYPSTLYPWSASLSGKLGAPPTPYYDPLQFMVEEAHRRNLEFHAWVNPFRMTTTRRDSDTLPSNHPARRPGWSVAYDGRLYLNPGLPAVRAHVMESIAEIVRRYDVDGIHLDDYFYPYPKEGAVFDDSLAYATYGKGRFRTLGEWRRDNINTFVRDTSQAIHRAKPQVKFGISPFGVWRNKESDPTGSDTFRCFSSYDSLHADARAWIDNGWIDYVAPQIYWHFGESNASFEKVLAWWVRETAPHPNLHLYIGHSAHLVGTDASPAWWNAEEIPNQLRYAQHWPQQIQGSLFYSMSDLRDNRLSWVGRLTNGPYRYPALVPEMPWRGGRAPAAPNLDNAGRDRNNQVQLSIRSQDSQAAYFAIYRFSGRRAGSLESAAALLATVHKTGSYMSITDRTALPGQAYTYVVTAVSRTHQESPPSPALTVR